MPIARLFICALQLIGIALIVFAGAYILRELVCPGDNQPEQEEIPNGK